MSTRKSAPESPEAEAEVVAEAEAVVEAAASTNKRRPSATVDSLDFDTGIEKSYRAPARQRETRWTRLLSELYDATAAGKVGRGEDGELLFIRVGHYNTPAGAAQQAKALKKVNGDTFEFKVAKSVDGGAGLYARVREVKD